MKMEDEIKEGLGEEQEKENNPESEEKEKGGKTYSDEELKVLLGKEKESGKNAFLKELGVDDENSLKELLAKKREEEEKNKTELQKVQESVVKLQNELETEKNKTKLAETKLEALKLDAKPESVDDLVSLALTKVTDDKNINTVIGELKVSYPFYFVNNKEEKEQEKHKGTKGNVRKALEKGTDEKEKEGKGGIAQRLINSKVKSQKKSSYFTTK